MNTLDILKRSYAHRDLAALEWKNAGKKIVGYFCTSVPEEIILAAGFFPLRISGDPWGGTEEADKYTEPFYEPDVRSMFSRVIAGRYDFLDYLIVPHSRESIIELHKFFLKLKHLNPSIKLPEIYLFDMLHTRSWMSNRYVNDRVQELKNKLEEWSGKKITNEVLSQSISICNESRTLLKKVAALRAAKPSIITGTQALQIIGSSMFMLKSDHNTLLKQFLNGIDHHVLPNSIRLFIEGSALDNLQFYELIESCNAIVVGEDNCWGNRYSDDLVDISTDPLEAITERYHMKSHCPWMHPMSMRVEYCLQNTIDSGAQGVIFFIHEYDNAPAWDYPSQKKVLEEHGIPTLCFTSQKYLLTEATKRELTTGIKQFVNDINHKNTR